MYSTHQFLSICMVSGMTEHICWFGLHLSNLCHSKCLSSISPASPSEATSTEVAFDLPLPAAEKYLKK